MAGAGSAQGEGQGACQVDAAAPVAGAADEFAARFTAAVPPSDLPLTEALRRFIRNELNLEVPVDSFRPDSAPPHLHMNFRVLDEHGRQLDMSRTSPRLSANMAQRRRTSSTVKLRSRS